MLLAVDCGDDEHRPRAHGELRQLRRSCSRRSWTSRTRCRSTARVVACADDPHAGAVLPRITRRVVTYGFDRRDDGRSIARHATSSSGRSAARCTVHRREPAHGERALGTLELPVPGRHNLQNALAAVAVAARARRRRSPASPAALRDFHGAERRFERHGRSRRRARRRRLRPSSDRDCRRARGGPRHARPPAGRRVPAAPLHAHARADATIRPGARATPTKSC